MATLFELAKVLRSKNSGPFELTIDVLFEDKEKYRYVKDSGIINMDTIGRLYNISHDRIYEIIFFDQALGFKITMLRDVSSGTVLDRDVYGAQQHAPLISLEI